MSHTFIEFKDNIIRVNETPLIIACLFLISVNESDFDSFFPKIKHLWFEQFERNNWGGIDLELDSFLLTEEQQQRFNRMLDKTIEFVKHNKTDDKMALDSLSKFPVTLGIPSFIYPASFILEFLNQLKNVVGWVEE